MKLKIIHRINFSVLLGILLLVISWRLFARNSGELASRVIVTCGYWFVLALLVLIVAVLCHFIRRFNVKQFLIVQVPAVLRRHVLGLCIIAVLTVVMHSSEPHRFRTMNDEYALIATSKMAHECKTLAVPGRMLYYNNQPVYIGNYSDIRLPLFSVLVSFIHDISGYRASNLFIMNFALTVICLALLYFLSVWITSSKALGLLAVAFAFSVPLLAQVATSGGYDLLNVTLIFLFAFTAYSYVQSATSEHQTFLIYSGLLLAYCRYESILYLAVVAFLVGRNWWITREVRLSFIDAISPVFLVLPICYNLYYTNLESYTSPKIDGRAYQFFDSEYFKGNVGEAISYFFGNPITSSTSVLIAILGLVSVVYLFAYILTNCRKKEMSRFVVSYAPICLVILSILTLIMFNYWGQLTDYQAVRFALPVMLGLIPVIIWFIWHNKLFRPIHLTLWGGATFIYCLGFSIPAQTQHYTTNSMIPSFFREFVLDYAKRNGSPRTLFISKAALGLISEGIPSVPFKFANKHPDRLIDGYHYGHYDVIYTEQILTYDRSLSEFTENPSLGSIGDRYKLETVELNRFSPMLSFRLARVVAICNRNGEWVDLLEPPEMKFLSPLDESVSMELFRSIP
jgi:hypothetical protein